VTVFRSVGARLSAALAAVVVVALTVVYVVVVPRLEESLVQAKLDQLRQSAETIAVTFPGDPFEASTHVLNAAFTTGATVAVLQPLVPTEPDSLALQEIQPPRGSTDEPAFEKDVVALRATLTGVTATGIVERNGQQFAEVAVPVRFDGTVLLFSASLRDQLENVALVERRLLGAGALALALALVLGYTGSWAFARRLRRLERAADRIAGGELEQPVRDEGRDEVGQLAAAFERMRQRLFQLERARREFIANASHELRTPLFALGGFLELLDDEDLDDRTRAEFVATMREQIERLTKLATDLLDLSRLDAGQLAVEQEPLDLAEVAGVVVDEFAALARTRGNELDAVGAGSVVALADEARVLQVARVLVDNALLHTPEGTRVRVRTRARDDRAQIVVEDEGAGIPSADVPHVFDRFYRVNGGMASGSGLGLAIARELAERMGGSLELESRPGRTAFTLSLPLARDAAPAEPVLAESV
jgi:two-component system, OmpR family, sensor kinase